MDDLKSRLLAPRATTPSGMPEADVEVPGMGTVRVRGLSRLEAIHVQSARGTAAIERRMLALAMVDPPMTEAEVGAWQRASEAGEMDPVSNKVNELSKMDSGAAKEAMREMLADDGAAFRDVPSAEVESDGSGATGEPE